MHADRWSGSLGGLDPASGSWLSSRVVRLSGKTLLFVALCTLSGVALATRSGDDRARAQDALKTLKANKKTERLAEEAIKQTTHALRRADDARAAGDTKHGPELEALAREWGETGIDLVRAAESEQKLGETQRELADTETKITRARALLEETVARRGRARAKLDELEKPKPGVPAPPKPATPPKAAPPKAPKPKP